MKGVDQKKWLDDYLDRYRVALDDDAMVERLLELRDLFLQKQSDGGKVIFAGNGGSASIASHCTVDLTKNAGVRCVNFNEADLITCFANDYGYERWLEKALEFYADSGDAVVLISSSGRSPNMVNAAGYAKSKGMDLITFTGFDEDNPLKSLGSLNFWVNSRAYNVVEMIHHIWVLAVCDLIIGDAEYSAS